MPDTTVESNLVFVGETRVLRHPRLRYLRWTRLAVGLFTTLWLPAAGVDSIFAVTKIPIGIYLLAIFVPVMLLEAGPFFKTCCGTDGICCRAFSLVLGFDTFMRAVLYVLFSIPCYISFIGMATMAVIAGILLDICAFLYLIKCFEYKKVKTYSAGAAVQPARPQTYGGADAS